MKNTKDYTKPNKLGIIFFPILLILLFAADVVFVYMLFSTKIKESVTDPSGVCINTDRTFINIFSFLETKQKNEIFFIVFIICISFLIAITLILLYLIVNKYNKFIYLNNKTHELSQKFDTTKQLLSTNYATTHKAETFKNNQPISIEEDNYNINKAIIDLYKIYVNALPELQ